MLMSCKCHIADLEVRHINESESIIISQRSALSLTSRPPHLQMLLKVSGQHITGDTAEALGNICCDTWLHGHTHEVVCAYEHEHTHAFALTDTVHHLTHTHSPGNEMKESDSWRHVFIIII